MIRIERVALREIRMPLVEPFRTAAGTVSERRVLLLQLGGAGGRTVWSECVAESLPSYSAETVDTCWLAIVEWLAPRVLGPAFASPREVDAALSRGVRGHRMARAALEMGAWTLWAAERGRSLAAVLAEESSPLHERRAVARGHVTTGVAIGLHDDPAELAERARCAVADGYQRIRIKIEPGCDVLPVRALLAAVAGRVPVIADANCSYSLDDASHVRALGELDTLGLSMLEQPLGAEDVVRHAELQRRMETRICLDESITSDARAGEAIAIGAARAINLKPGRVGGFTEALAIHDRCARERVALWCGGMLETGIGRACNVALASLPGFTDAGDLSPSARYWASDVVEPAWTMDSGGRVRVPSAAGLGVAVREAEIDALTVKTQELRLA